MIIRNGNRKSGASHHKFIHKAAAAGAATGKLGFPIIANSYSPVVVKMQGSWSASDIFVQMAREFVTRVD